MIKLFVYGTLDLPNVQIKVIGRESPTLPDTLEEYEKAQVVINGKTYPIAIYSPGAQIEGRVMEITESELTLIDDYETKAYGRIEVTLTSGTKAQVYIRP